MAAPGDGLFFDYSGQIGDGQQYSPQQQQDAQSHPRMPSWPLPTSTQHQQTQGMTVPSSSSSSPQMNMNAYKRSSSPLPMSMAQQHQYQDASAASANQLMGNWPMTGVQMPTLAIETNVLTSGFAGDFGDMSFQHSPNNLLPQHSPYLAQGIPPFNPIPMNEGMSMFTDIAPGLDMPLLQDMPMEWPNIPNVNVNEQLFGAPDGTDISRTSQPSYGAGSPNSECYRSGSEIEIGSFPSTDGEWVKVPQSHVHPHRVFPLESVHHRSPSDSSSDFDQRISCGSSDGYIDVAAPMESPSESGPESVYSDQGLYQLPSPPPITTAPLKRNSKTKSPTSPVHSTDSRVTKSINKPKATVAANKPGGRRATIQNGGKEEKRVGKRKGPLSASQRQQASEIRKLGACIRCRFLKKTCDKGDPCAGCQPSHARLWLVPCTRVDIKDLGYFLKGWKADYERHVTLNVSIANVKGYSEHEKTLLVTHGYGHYLPIKAREVYVRDDSVFGVNWIEAHSGSHEEFKVDTARLSAGVDGVSSSLLSEYLDMHIDGGFEHFVDEHFQGTPFVTEMLKIAYRFYTREKTPQIRKALKLVLAYNLTQAILLVRGFGAEEEIDGKIDDSRSEFNGETAAPMMINFQVKTAMAELWRDLQKSLLEDLSQLYSSIYSRDKLKHWPTIFMIASVLLVVWEEMQFDCRYRIPDEKMVDKFCHDMESTPVGVIVGLFSAISQKVPSFTEWDTPKHAVLLGSNESVCEAMENVRDGIKKHDKYLRGRTQAKFDRNDFDSLSNMFVSKLVIRAH